jgi:hypothetical protein
MIVFSRRYLAATLETLRGGDCLQHQLSLIAKYHELGKLKVALSPMPKLHEKVKKLNDL